jgi:hypothetical protein
MAWKKLNSHFMRSSGEFCLRVPYLYCHKVFSLTKLTFIKERETKMFLEELELAKAFTAPSFVELKLVNGKDYSERYRYQI